MLLLQAQLRAARAATAMHSGRSVSLMLSVPDAFVVPDVSVPCVVFEDEQIAVVAKPAGERVPLQAWVCQGGVAASLAEDALDAPLLVTPLSGLVPFAKTAAAAACLRAETSSTLCEYAALVSGAPDCHCGASCGRLRLEWLETSACRPRTGRGFAHARCLSLVATSAQADLDSERVCDEFGAAGLCVVGAREIVPGQKVRAGREARRADVAQAEGGAHLALVGLTLPPPLAALRPADAPFTFRIAPPTKYAKLMKSERLEAERRAAKKR